MITIDSCDFCVSVPMCEEHTEVSHNMQKPVWNEKCRSFRQLRSVRCARFWKGT